VPCVAAKPALADLRSCALSLGTLERSAEPIRPYHAGTLPQPERQRESAIGHRSRREAKIVAPDWGVGGWGSGATRITGATGVRTARLVAASKRALIKIILTLDMPDEIADGFDLSFRNFNAGELIFDQYH